MVPLAKTSIKVRITTGGQLSRSQSQTGNTILEAPPPLLAAEPAGVAFPARGWKRDLNYRWIIK
ncbi:hypothetical protein ACWATR_27270 [Nostoc sp. UIC 10890]